MDHWECRVTSTAAHSNCLFCHHHQHVDNNWLSYQSLDQAVRNGALCSVLEPVMSCVHRKCQERVIRHQKRCWPR